ncbi:unnamed protein product [Leptosia nina]|uniref:Kinetochore protein Nuf2 n=1 Tax=Leptosia nina TaxID=320188 RepID=A0AAV1IVU9_9NEOP
MNNTVVTVDRLVEMWNQEFPSDPLTVADMKEPKSIFNSLLLVFQRLNIDKEAVLKPCPKEEQNESSYYYSDLIPVINLTRVLNYVLMEPAKMNVEIMISNFLQPTVNGTFPIMMLIFNYMLFVELQLEAIKPFEDDILVIHEQVKSLENQKNDIIIRLNNYSLSKSERIQRMLKLEEQIKVIDEEVRREKVALDAESLELEPILQKNHKEQKTVEQIIIQKDAINADIEKCKSQLVTDADDIKEQERKLVQEMAEAEMICNSQSATLLQKENRLMNLQTIKQIFDGANECLQEILVIVDWMKESEKGDFDGDSEEGELKMLNTELGELHSQYSELMTAREEIRKKRQESAARRQQARATADRCIHDLEKREKELKEKARKETQEIEEIKQRLNEYDRLETVYPQQQAEVKEQFMKEVKSLDEQVVSELKKFGEIIKVMLEKRR